MKAPRLWWSVFLVGTFAVTGGLVWLSVGTIRSERASVAARAEADHQAALRLALWRLDAWLGGFLAREAARPHEEYLPQPTSALRTFNSDYIRLHFQLDAAGRLTSPQPSFPGRDETLRRLARAVDFAGLRHRVAAAESRLAERLETTVWPPAGAEFSRRAAAGATCQTPNGTESEVPSFINPIEDVRVGPLVALWLEPTADDTDFVFVRRADWLGSESLQGFLGDWPSLREALQTQVADLFPEARLERALTSESGADPRRLATLPAILHVVPAAAPDPAWSSTHRKLVLVWLAVAVAIAAVGFTLAASIDFGRRRQRFAAAVAHELRTPLTTFRMYTEMLADGSIREPDQRQEYLDILQHESERLSGLVDNVLAYAGLEERPAARQIEHVTVSTLLERVTPPLERLAANAGLTLEVDGEASAGTQLEVDVDLVSRLLFNLVDNACKYAGPATLIRLGVDVHERHLFLRVRDHGPGIARAEARRVFRPFERGGSRSEDPRSGAGLGLALARGLARASGGDLTLEASPGEGACFQVKLQAVP